jgi:hypothetical protein
MARGRAENSAGSADEPVESVPAAPPIAAADDRPEAVNAGIHTERKEMAETIRREPLDYSAGDYFVPAGFAEGTTDPLPLPETPENTGERKSESQPVFNPELKPWSFTRKGRRRPRRGRC